MKINVTGGTLPQQEIDYYTEAALKKYPNRNITDISSGEEIFKRNADLVADCDIECVSKPCSDEGLFQKIKSFFSIWFDILN